MYNSIHNLNKARENNMLNLIMIQVNKLMSNGMSYSKSLQVIFDQYICEYNSTNNNATKSEINKITDFIMGLKRQAAKNSLAG